MRQKGESASLAERLNNALAQQHAQKLAFDSERVELQAQLERAKEENERLRGKNRQLRRGKEGDELKETDPEGEQVILKIQHYLTRLQQSSKQMAQVASECRVFDSQIERASALIERNILKTASGLQKYTQELVRQWCSKQTLRLQNERLEKENKSLFQLTTKLQQNFKETDRLIKQMTRAQGKEDKYSQELKGRIARLEQDREGDVRREAVDELQEKIQRLGEKVRSLEQENTTIKNIHQRTMKKLERLEQRNRQKEEGAPEGNNLQDQRRMWLEKTDQMYDEVRRLTKELLLAQQSEKKVKQELARCIDIYGQWEVEREELKAEIEKLKNGIQIYLEKIEELEGSLSEARGEVEAMQERLQISEGQKQKIVSVYQLEVQELNDLLFKKQDALTQMDTIINKEHLRLEQLKKQHSELGKFTQNLQDNNKKAVAEIADLRQSLRQQEQIQSKLKDTIAQAEEAAKQLKLAFQKEKKELKNEMERQQQEKQEMVDIMNEYKDEYYSAKKDMAKLQEDLHTLQDQQYSIKQELRSILSLSDDTVDVWALLAQTRDHLTLITAQNKSLKDAQRRLLIQYQNKIHELNSQLEQITQFSQSSRQNAEDAKKNQEFTLKIYKMKVSQRQISNEKSLSRATNLTELLDIVIGNAKKEEKQTYLDVDSDEIQKLREEIFTLQESERKLKEIVAKQKNKANQAEEDLRLLRLSQKGNDDTYRQAEQHLSEAMRELSEEKQLNEKLLQQIEALRHERQAANTQMVALASQLNKIQNEMDDYEDEKSSIQSKLENARKIHIKNEELQEKVNQLEDTIQQLENTIQQLEYKVKDIQNKSEEEFLKQEEPAEQSGSQLLDKDESQLADKDKSIKPCDEEQKYLIQIDGLLKENNELQAQLSQKNNRIAELEHSIMLLNENYHLQVIKLQKLEQEMQRKNDELNEYRRIFMQLEQERQYFAVIKQELMKKEQQANQQHLQNSNDYIQLTLQNQASMHQIDHLQQRIRQLQGLLEISSNKIAKLSAQIQQQATLRANTAQQQLNLKNINHQLREDIIARQEQLIISLAKIHQKQARMHTEEIQLRNKSQQLKQAQEEVQKSYQEMNQKFKELNKREKQVQLHEIELFKREEQLKALQKQPSPFERSQLGMESMRQSQNVNNIPISSTEESTLQQLKQELNFARRIIKDKESICQIKQSQLDELLQKKKEDKKKLDYFQKQVAQLEEQLNQYKEHSQHLKSSLQDLTHEKQMVQNYSQQLRKEKEQLEDNIQQLNNLLQENTIKNRILTEKIQNGTVQNQKSIYHLQAQLTAQQTIINEQQSRFQQQEATIKQFTQLLAEKQQILQKMQTDFQQKQKSNKEAVSQINSIRIENQELLRELDQMNGKCSKMQMEVDVVRQQNIQYAQRLNEIEDLMDALKKQQADSQLLREQLEETLIQKQQLEESVKDMKNNYVISNSNLAIFQKRNKELSDQLSVLRQQQQTVKLNYEKVSKQLERCKQSQFNFKEALSRYQKLGTISELTTKIQAYAANVKIVDELKDKCTHLERNNSQMKIRIHQLERDLSKRNEEIDIKMGKNIKLEEQCQQLKGLIQRSSPLADQNQQLVNKNKQLRQDLEQCRQELLQRQAKISQLKQLNAKQSTQRELLESQLREMTINYQNVQQQAQHYKMEVKRIGKQKAQAKSEAIKNKFSLQEQQSVLKIKQSELQQELKKNSSEKEELIRQLRQEIDSLRQQNSVLQENSVDSVSRTSRRSSTMGHPNYQNSDMPLQIPPRSRQKSVQIQEEKSQEEQESRFMKAGKGDKLSTRLHQSEKSNISLIDEVQTLRGELRGRQANIDTLERQFKSKVEDYSKLQRIVESLRDELNLERKRVKNFEDLYQSIQEKRIKISNPKNE